MSKGPRLLIEESHPPAARHLETACWFGLIANGNSRKRGVRALRILVEALK